MKNSVEKIGVRLDNATASLSGIVTELDGVVKQTDNEIIANKTKIANISDEIKRLEARNSMLSDIKESANKRKTSINKLIKGEL